MGPSGLGPKPWPAGALLPNQTPGELGAEVEEEVTGARGA